MEIDEEPETGAGDGESNSPLKQTKLKRQSLK
jgi:hypothetical protein